jgi:hypothetical protein
LYKNGWPSFDGTATSLDNARTSKTNLVQHEKTGTPKRLGKSICVFEENQKQAQDEKF